MELEENIRIYSIYSTFATHLQSSVFYDAKMFIEVPQVARVFRDQILQARKPFGDIFLSVVFAFFLSISNDPTLVSRDAKLFCRVTNSGKSSSNTLAWPFMFWRAWRSDASIGEFSMLAQMICVLTGIESSQFFIKITLRRNDSRMRHAASEGPR